MTTNSRLRGLNPTAAQQIVATAQALEAGRPNDAAIRLAPVLAAYPDQPEVLRLHAGILSQRGDYRTALASMRRALVLRPDDALYYNTLASILGASGEFDTAIVALRRACELQPTLAVAWYNLGILLTRSVRHEEAMIALKTAVVLAPDHVAARALLGDMLRMQGQVQESQSEYRKVIAEQPWAGMAWWGLADLKILRLVEADIAQMQRAMQDKRADDDNLIAMGFALAKALEDQGRYAESLETLAQANTIARRRHQWDASAFSAGIVAILKAFAPPSAPASTNELGHGTIFVVGLPRSGSTLVEQILATHSLVEGAGELPDLPLTLGEESRRRGNPFPDWAREMQPADWQRLGNRYLQRTARWSRHRPVFIDKLPGNWYYIDAIRAMLPGAHIVVCRRDPLETCFSCYRQRLPGNEYTRTFEDLAAYWRDFDVSAKHFSALHSAHVYQHDYEALVADPEFGIRTLLARCGLPFEEACMRFYETKRDVRSPSATQVRQPLQRDTARAPRYGVLLDPLRTALGLPVYAG